MNILRSLVCIFGHAYGPTSKDDAPEWKTCLFCHHCRKCDKSHEEWESCISLEELKAQNQALVKQLAILQAQIKMLYADIPKFTGQMEQAQAIKVLGEDYFA
jgi:hypothetical protein